MSCDNDEATSLHAGEPEPHMSTPNEADLKRAERFVRRLAPGANWTHELAKLLARVRDEAWHKGHGEGWEAGYDAALGTVPGDGDDE